MVDVTHSRGTVLRIVEEDVVSIEKVGSHRQKVPLVGRGRGRKGRGKEGEGRRGREGGGGGGRGEERKGLFLADNSRDDSPAHQLRTLYRGRLYSLYLE